MVERHIQALTDFCRTLVDVCIGVLNDDLAAAHDDHMGFMLATFSPLQVSHLHAAVELVAMGRFPQAGIVARTMLEGLGVLHWCNKDHARARRWRAYSLIHDLRLIRVAQSQGQTLEPSHEADVMARLRVEGPTLLKPRRRSRTDDQTLGDPDSYFPAWHVGPDGQPVSISSVIEDGLDDPQLRELYGYFSAHVHWSANGIGRHLRLTSTGYSFDLQAEPRDGAAALAMGFQACGHVFALLAQHFSLAAHLERIEKLAAEYVAQIRSLGRPS